MDFVLNSILPAVIVVLLGLFAGVTLEWMATAPARWAHKRKLQQLRAERRRMIEAARLADRKRMIEAAAHAKRGKGVKPFLRK